MKTEGPTAPAVATVTTYSLLGQRISLRSDCPRAHAAFAGLYRRTPALSGQAPGLLADLIEIPSENAWEARAANLPPRRSATLGHALQRAETAFCTHALQYARHRVGLHAATIGFGDRWALITGDSGAGKTTLTLALSARGHPLDGDDVATLDPESGLVQGLPRCFHLDDPSIALLRAGGLDVRRKEGIPDFLTPADVGDAGMAPRAVGAVFFLRAGNLPEPALTPLTLAEAVVGLEAQSGPRYRSSSELYPLLGQMLQQARCFELRRGPLAATADLVAATMRGLQP